jgi:hypothetical protein
MTDQEIIDWDYDGPKTLEKRCELIAEFLNRYFIDPGMQPWTAEEVYEQFTPEGELIHIFSHYSAAARFFYNKFRGPIEQAPACVRQDNVDALGYFI